MNYSDTFEKALAKGFLYTAVGEVILIHTLLLFYDWVIGLPLAIFMLGFFGCYMRWKDEL